MTYLIKTSLDILNMKCNDFHNWWLIKLPYWFKVFFGCFSEFTMRTEKDHSELLPVYSVKSSLREVRLMSHRSELCHSLILLFLDLASVS